MTSLNAPAAPTLADLSSSAPVCLALQEMAEHARVGCLLAICNSCVQYVCLIQSFTQQLADKKVGHITLGNESRSLQWK